MPDSNATRVRRITRPRRVTVVDSCSLGPRMRRLTLFAEDLRGGPPVHAGAHIKLLFPMADGGLVLPSIEGDTVRWPKGPRPPARTYSVRRHDATRGTFEVDFVLHGDNGPASRWATRAGIGDALGLGGPGGPELFREEADFHLLAGDLSALPAIAAVLDALPPGARGAAFIEINEAADQQSLRHPAGVRLHWLQRASLIAAVRELQWPGEDLRVSATIAGESSAVMALRHHLLHGRGLPRADLYAVPYWRRGSSEEDYHAERHRQMDEEE